MCYVINAFQHQPVQGWEREQNIKERERDGDVYCVHGKGSKSINAVFMVNILMSSENARTKEKGCCCSLNDSLLSRSRNGLFSFLYHKWMVFVCVCNNCVQSPSITLIHLGRFYVEHMHRKWIKPNQKNRTQHTCSFKEAKLIGIVRMHLAEIEFRCKQNIDGRKINGINALARLICHCWVFLVGENATANVQKSNSFFFFLYFCIVKKFISSRRRYLHTCRL